ncbi:outer membrane beta-barrel protein, partial [Acinetobacter baumannii]
DGRVDLAAHTSLGAELSQARLVEPRGTTGDTLFGAKPITYDRTIAGLTLAQDFGLTRVQLGARYQRFAYQNRTLDGSTIDLSGRD